MLLCATSYVLIIHQKVIIKSIESERRVAGVVTASISQISWSCIGEGQSYQERRL